MSGARGRRGSGETGFYGFWYVLVQSHTPHSLIFVSLLGALLVAGGCNRVNTGPSVPAAPPPPPTYRAQTTVAGVPVGGYTLPDAEKLLKTHLSAIGARPFYLTYGSRMYRRTLKDVGITPNLSAMLSSAWSEETVPLLLTIDRTKAAASIRRAARAIDVAPVCPRFVGAPSWGKIREGKTGRRVDVGATFVLLRDAIQADTEVKRSPLVVVPHEPAFTSDDLVPINHRLITYTTLFNPREINRTHNLQLVAQRLNGALVMPGEVFSFNGWVGERTASSGFREAIVYKYGKMEKETGGGLCQVSSTLYNVALLTGLPIRQRSHHSLTVHYVPLGRDATVYWGRHDLRFENDTSTPLYIRTRTGRSSLTVEAWGIGPLERKVNVTSTAGWRGTKATARVYRTIAVNGQKSRELVSDDEYETRHEMAVKAPGGRRT